MEPCVRLSTKPAGPGDRIAHARLEADGALIFASLLWVKEVTT